MKTVLVTGADGQLGKSIRDLAGNFSSHSFVFSDTNEMDITNMHQVHQFFSRFKPDYCINCAAYTQVDKAETEREKCHQVNVIGVENLIKASREFQTVLIQVSTDFVFDGSKGKPYKTDDRPNPLNEYGLSKYSSEEAIQSSLEKYFIVRTSWVFSEYGHNFVKTMLRLATERDEIRVVNDQRGCPTYARDLAGFLLYLIASGNASYGIMHYSNRGEVSWHEFAQAILSDRFPKTRVLPIRSEELNLVAKRPAYSALDLTKTEELLSAELPNWRVSLNLCLQRIED